MNNPFKMKPGRGDMPKTGRDIPLNMKSPNYQVDGPGDDKDPKSGKTKDPVLDRLKKQYPNQTITANYPKKQPSWAKKKEAKYTATDKSGHSVTVKPGKKGSAEKKYGVAEAINKSLKDEKSGKVKK